MTENLIHVLTLVAPSFLIIAAGSFYSIVSKSDPDYLIQVTMKALVPAFAFHQILQMQIQIDVLSTVFLCAWCIMLGCGLLAFVIFRGLSLPIKGLYLPIMFMNTVNLPFPILLSAYGEKAIFFTLSFYLASILGVFTIGVLIVSSENSSYPVLKEPVIYVIATAFYLKYSDTHVPSVLTHTLDILQRATIPIILLALGMQLTQTRLTQIKESLIAAACRMVGGFLIGNLCVWAFHLEGLARKVVLFNSIMPGAVLTYMVAQRFNTDSDRVASMILISTLLSILLIPLILLYLD